MDKNAARQQVLELIADFQVEPTSLVSYQSKGRLLALGDEAALQRCAELADGIAVETVVTAPGQVRIEGHLGAYKVAIGDAAGNWEKHQCDAILDLGESPILAREMLPPGYFHLPPALWESFDFSELESLDGEFQKPRYFDYDASICAHSVNGKIVCRQCIDACPAEAITSLAERIEVDPYLCQGGGSCTSVCPSGAIRYRYPGLRDSGRRLRDGLQRFRELGPGDDAIVFFHSASGDSENYCRTYDNLLPVEVEELGSVGMDLCLSALAYGAAQVVLYIDQDTPASSVANLRRQIDWVRELLIALGMDTESVTLCDTEAAFPAIEPRAQIIAAEYDTPRDKRSAIFQAVDHLVAQLQPSANAVELPVPAPFGEAVIDAGKCTLCMACVGACPGKALQDGSNRAVPEVFFVESNCLQCGACVQTCPEDAIALVPRLLLQREERNRGRTLNQDTPFQCINCGKPFAPTSVISKMQEKLKDHHMFATSRALDRLKMCEDCRVIDIVEDAEAMGGQFDPRSRFR